MSQISQDTLIGAAGSPTLFDDSTLAEFGNLVHRAHGQEEIYQKTWSQSSLEAQIKLYHAALDVFSAPEGPYLDHEETLLHEGRTLTVHVEPFVNHYQLALRLERRSVPDTLINILIAATCELDGTLPKDPCEDLPLEGRYRAALATCCVELSNAYHQRYVHVGMAGDVALALSYATLALGTSSYSRKTRALALRNVGRALILSFKQTREASIINCAVEALRNGLYLATGCISDVEAFSVDLGASLIERHNVLGSQEDIAEATELLEITLSHSRPDYNSFPQARVELAACLFRRFDMLNKMEDLQKATDLVFEALAIQSRGNPARIKSLLYASFLLLRSFEFTGTVAHLQKSIQYAKELTSSCNRMHFMRADALNALSIALRYRSRLEGRLEDMEHAALAAQECLEVNPNHPRAIGNLAIILNEQYTQSGNPDYIDASIRLQRRQLATMDPRHPTYDTVLMSLALIIMEKSDNTLDSKPLNEAISLLRQAYTLRPFGHACHRHSLFNLAECLHRRFIRNQSIDDLQEALHLHNSWLFSEQLAEPHRKHWYLRNIAETRQASFEQGGDLDDLNVAIEMLEQACNSFSQGPADSQLEQHTTMGRLGSSFGLRAVSTGSEADALKALTLLSRALDLIPTGYPNRCELMFELAKLYGVEGTEFRDLSTALDTYNKAVADGTYPAAVRLFHAVKALDKLDSALFSNSESTREMHSKLLEAYQATIQLLPEVAYFGLDPHIRLRALANTPTIAANAAACAASGGQLESAVELLEEGRSVFWSQHMRLRTPLENLPRDLAEKIESAVNQLEIQGKVASAESVTESEARLTKQRELSQKLTELTKSARSLPGLERFMLPDAFASLARSARHNTVLILIATPRFCGGILLRDPKTPPVQLRFNARVNLDQVKSLYEGLHRATGELRGTIRGRAMKYKSTRSGAHKSVFEQMWTMVMQDVVRALGWKKAEGINRPRLTICATGLFTHLPVHAAGVHTDGAWDYFVPSYTPTLGVLLAANERFKPILKSSASLLLAAVPNPYKWTRLPNVVEEMKIIQQAFPTSRVLRLREQTTSTIFASASCEDVLDCLPRADILHLACHGHHDTTNTLDSGFVMRDKMLTITDLMRLNLPNSFLAFLSACETAKNAEAQPDQAVHLAAAMLFAGFKSVIGTMWSMDDVDGPIVAKRVYEELFRGDSKFFEPDSIPYAVDAAVGELRAKKVHPSRWAPYIHMGI